MLNKRLISLFLTLLMIMSAAPAMMGVSFASDPKYTPGDVDGNGQILANDARLALRVSAKLENNLTKEQLLAADVDRNGQILANDARQILRFSAKLLREFETAAPPPTDDETTTKKQETTTKKEETTTKKQETTTKKEETTTNKEESDPRPQDIDYRVVPAEWANVEWEQYENVYFTLTIPKGWKVEWQGNAQQLYWRVTNPEETVGLSNLDHRYAAKDIRYMQMGGTDMCLVEGTVREFFETAYANSTDYFTVKNSTVPGNKSQLQAIRPSTPIRDYQSLYAVFKENGLEGEGIYSAVVMESPDVWAYGMNYGMWEINCIFTEWAPLGELVNWQPVLSTIAQSFRYTAYYVQEWRSVLGTNASPDGQTNIGDSVLEAFEERSTADTILQEKRSDMIGEYERVVDNETGNIYRAYNGFLDDIGSEQTRYSPITENQYADGFFGWIDKS